MTKKDWTPTNNDLSYYPLLKEALDSTKGSVIECGTGHGSTPHLHEYCLENSRMLYSFETDPNWLKKFEHFNDGTHKLWLIDNWRDVYTNHSSADVVFIDHAPGNDREKMILDYIDTKGILVCHDTEPGQADEGYQMRKHFSKFKYVVEIKTNGAQAAAMSNEIDITKWIGKKYGAYEISSH
jgi:predicted O-methyltransferase YrrM